MVMKLESELRLQLNEHKYDIEGVGDSLPTMLRFVRGENKPSGKR